MGGVGGEDSTGCVLASFHGAVWYEDLWRHGAPSSSASDDPVAQEGETFGNMGDFGLVLCERQSHGAEEGSKFLFHGVGFCLCAITEHHKIIGISDVEVIALTLLPSLAMLIAREVQVCGFHIPVELMEVYVGQQGTHDASLRC